MKQNKKEKGNFPNLRFKEFQGEWEERKLGEIAVITKGVGISKEQLSETGHLCILYGELYTKYKSEIIQKILSHTNIDSAKLVKSKANDVIIPSSGETAIDIATARCVLFSDILLGGDINIIRLKNDNGSFLSYQLNGVRKYDIAKIAQGISVVHLYGENLKKLKITICSNEEQNKIAVFLSLIDERISTQIKIIEKYESLIKGINNFIFEKLKTEKTIPFYQLYDKAGEGGTPDTKISDYYKNGEIPFIKIDDLKGKYLENNQSFISETGLKNSSAWLVPANSIIYSNGATIGSISINKYTVATKQGILGIVLKVGISLEYMYYFMISQYFKREICKVTTQGTMKTAYLKDINKIKCFLPDYETQINVVRILNVLSLKIEIEKQFLNNLEKQKQYLLQQMFI